MNAKTKPEKAKAPAAQYQTKVDDAAITITHAFRRRYIIQINGQEAGYVTGKDVMNVVGRVETAKDLKALEAMLLH